MALYDKITFQKKLNDSVQVGDDLYFSNITNPNAPTAPEFVSKINWVGEKEIRINPNTAPPSILNTQIADVNIMDNYNGNFDTDISSWDLSSNPGPGGVGTISGICSGGVSTDQATCVGLGDCGLDTDIDQATCATYGSCNFGGYTDENTCISWGDCYETISYITPATGASTSTNMIQTDCENYGDCDGIDPSGAVISGTTVASQEQSPCLATGNCFDHTNALAPSYTTSGTCTANTSCVDGSGADVTATYGNSNACIAVGTCTGTNVMGGGTVNYNVPENYSGSLGCIGNPFINNASWVANNWTEYSWIQSAWSGYSWLKYEWSLTGAAWNQYDWVYDGSVYHATASAVNPTYFTDGSARMYLDSMQGLGTSGHVGQTVGPPGIELIPNDEYTFTFDAEIVLGELNFQISGALVDSGTYTNTSGTNGQISYSNTFIAGSSSLTIKFFGTDGDPTFAYIDNVSILDDQYVQTGLDNFFMFQKPSEQNVSSLKGYYAEVTLTNNSTAKQELFAVGSEITISSK